MTDNEFDHKYSENLKNNRTIIYPDAKDWADLDARLDQFYLHKKSWKHLIPWVLVPLLALVAIWEGTSNYNLTRKLDDIGKSVDIKWIQKDTVYIENQIFVHDTLYVEKKLKPQKFAVISKSQANDSDTSSKKIVQLDSPLTHEQIHNFTDLSDIKILPQNTPSYFPSLWDKTLPVKYLKQEKSSFKRANINIGLATGMVIPMIKAEIKNPFAVEIFGELSFKNARFSLIPAIAYTQHFFEYESIHTNKILFSPTNISLNPYDLHEIKGIKKSIIPSLMFRMNFTSKKWIQYYAGIGIGSILTRPIQVEYEYLERTTNNSFKVNQLMEKRDDQYILLTSMGGTLNFSPQFSLFTDLKMGIGKGKENEYDKFVATFIGLKYNMTKK